MRALLYRLAFVPIFLAMVIASLVWTATHPFAPARARTAAPVLAHFYFEPMPLISGDGTALTAYMVPLIDERTVLISKERILRRRDPVAILVHDFGADARQMLHLVKPLHEAGYIVVLASLRGAAGQTFGLNEAMDIKATVDALRLHPFVDPDRIALIGTGTGATAALLAGSRDPKIAALVLDDPLSSSEDAVSRLAPDSAALSWLRPLCKWTFELAYHVDADDLNLHGYTAMLATRPVLMRTGESGGNRQIEMFLKKHLSLPARTNQRLADVR